MPIQSLKKKTTLSYLLSAIRSIWAGTAYATTVVGVDPTGQIDCTDLVNKYLRKNRKLVFTAGTYRVDGMIMPRANGHIVLESGAKLIRLATHSSSTDPVVFINNSNVILEGTGDSSSIETENDSPLGVVSIGEYNMTKKTGYQNKCHAHRFKIVGKTPDDTTGNYGLYLCGPQIDNTFTNYFGWVSDLSIHNAQFGLGLIGWPDGYHINNMHYFHCSVALDMAGCVDNHIHGLFHHTSPDGTTISVRDYDNTGVTGGKLHKCYFNDVTGIICEQTGASAQSIVFDSASELATHNNFSIRSNVSGGWDIPDYARIKNHFLINDIAYFSKVIASHGSLPTSLVDAGGVAFESVAFYTAMGSTTTKPLYQQIRISNFTGAPAETEDHPTYELNLVGDVRTWIRK